MEKEKNIEEILGSVLYDAFCSDEKFEVKTVQEYFEIKKDEEYYEKKNIHSKEELKVTPNEYFYSTSEGFTSLRFLIFDKPVIVHGGTAFGIVAPRITLISSCAVLCKAKEVIVRNGIGITFRGCDFDFAQVSCTDYSNSDSKVRKLLLDENSTIVKEWLKRGIGITKVIGKNKGGLDIEKDREKYEENYFFLHQELKMEDVQDFLSQLDEKGLREFAGGIALENKDNLYRILWEDYVKEDFNSRVEEFYDHKNVDVESCVYDYVWGCDYDCNLDYWTNFDNIIQNNITPIALELEKEKK